MPPTRLRPGLLPTLIAFETDRGGDWDIWTMEDDGGNEMQLIANEGVDDFSPAWAPSP
jgi:Tol biopolymer transport system component